MNHTKQVRHPGKEPQYDTDQNEYESRPQLPIDPVAQQPWQRHLQGDGRHPGGPLHGHDHWRTLMWRRFHETRRSNRLVKAVNLIGPRRSVKDGTTSFNVYHAFSHSRTTIIQHFAHALLARSGFTRHETTDAIGEAPASVSNAGSSKHRRSHHHSRGMRGSPARPRRQQRRQSMHVSYLFSVYCAFLATAVAGVFWGGDRCVAPRFCL